MFQHQQHYTFLCITGLFKMLLAYFLDIMWKPPECSLQILQTKWHIWLKIRCFIAFSGKCNKMHTISWKCVHFMQISCIFLVFLKMCTFLWKCHISIRKPGKCAHFERPLPAWIIFWFYCSGKNHSMKFYCFRPFFSPTKDIFVSFYN